MEIIDTHLHIWDLDKFSLPWLDDEGEILNRTYLLEDYKKSLSYLENINFKKLGYFNKIFLLKILLKFRLGKILKKYFMNRTKY